MADGRRNRGLDLEARLTAAQRRRAVREIAHSLAEALVISLAIWLALTWTGVFTRVGDARPGAPGGAGPAAVGLVVLTSATWALVLARHRRRGRSPRDELGFTIVVLACVPLVITIGSLWFGPRMVGVPDGQEDFARDLVASTPFGPCHGFVWADLHFSRFDADRIDYTCSTPPVWYHVESGANSATMPDSSERRWAADLHYWMGSGPLGPSYGGPIQNEPARTGVVDLGVGEATAWFGPRC